MILGEVYGIAQKRGVVLWQLRRFKHAERIINGDPSDTYVMLCPLNSPVSPADADYRMRIGDAFMADGPIGISKLAPSIVGRVIGIYEGDVPGKYEGRR